MYKISISKVDYTISITYQVEEFDTKSTRNLRTRYEIVTASNGNIDNNTRKLFESDSTVFKATLAGLGFFCGVLSLAFIIFGCFLLYRYRRHCFKNERNDERKDDVGTCTPNSKQSGGSSSKSVDVLSPERFPKLNLPCDSVRDHDPEVSSFNGSPSIISFLESAGRAYDDLNGITDDNGQPIGNDRIKTKKFNVDIAGMSIDSSSIWQQDSTPNKLGGGQHVIRNYTTPVADRMKKAKYSTSRQYPDDEI